MAFTVYVNGPDSCRHLRNEKETKPDDLLKEENPSHYKRGYNKQLYLIFFRLLWIS
ncbi:hypothetical protein P9D87_10905 [Bacillus mojavensis]|uniref:hypothetical protein n=1 Tax=Bacillus mojavensis TaxID=72360 RepID=UPI002DB6C2A4|nr:hypothetical protein [Bacillus mojavensis]MEC1737484.1 hypothetical protein [Bacillus mojavensis]MEC1794685.1 hypothetical protein [Bacillus mojavensis]